MITRVFESVKVVEIVGLSAELQALSAPSELFHQERVVLLHDLPNQLSWNCRHFSCSTPTFSPDTHHTRSKFKSREPSLVVQEN